MKLRWKPFPNRRPNTFNWVSRRPPRVGEEVGVQGPTLSGNQVEATIRRHLGLPELPQEAKKGFLDRLLKK